MHFIINFRIFSKIQDIHSTLSLSLFNLNIFARILTTKLKSEEGTSFCKQKHF